MTTHTIDVTTPVEQRISVEVDAKTVSKAIQAKVRTKAVNINYGGFRPNKASTQQLAAKKITPAEEAELYNKLCRDSFTKLCADHNIHYVGTPILEGLKYNTDSSLSYTILIEVYPNIPHVNWNDINFEKLETELTDEAFSAALPKLEEMGLQKLVQNQVDGMRWCASMIEIFQHQQRRNQVMQLLFEHNTVDDLPPRLLESRYQELKRDYDKEQSKHAVETDAPTQFKEEDLRHKARQYITADILFKAYALEHKIEIDTTMLSKRIKEASNTPHIMQEIKDPSLLPYYIAPRVLEETVVNHLVDHANCTTKSLPLADFIKLFLTEQPSWP